MINLCTSIRPIPKTTKPRQEVHLEELTVRDAITAWSRVSKKRYNFLSTIVMVTEFCQQDRQEEPLKFWTTSRDVNNIN